MFNWAGSSYRYNHKKILGGSMVGDYQTHKTMFAGPDPADPQRVLVRKLVQTSDNVWAFEEARITPSAEGGQPSVHTTLHRLGWFDINENVSERELAMRLTYRPVTNVVGFSLFTRAWNNSRSVSWTMTENTLNKTSGYRWQEWFRDLQDRRDIAAYLHNRWVFN